MQRCIELAKLGAGSVAPNPMVGSLLVYQNRIIGEGYHQLYGQAHAEVNCIRSVKPEDINLIAESTLYVSLEPCAHFGKTPPCADLIVNKKIPSVVVGCRDPFKEVNGKGIEKLLAAGIQVTTGVLEKECLGLNKRFFTFHTHYRPWLVLKWAQTADGFIGNTDHSRLLISNSITNRLVHRWRSEEAAILVGANTALFDDPALTTRFWPGANPVRLVVDMDLRLPQSLKLFDGSVRTIVFNSLMHAEKGNLLYYQCTKEVSLVHQICHALYQMNVQSLLVEGGAQLLQSFIDENMYDEIRIITSTALHAGGGISAPVVNGARQLDKINIQSDKVSIYTNIKAT